jgi:hypothetical protein
MFWRTRYVALSGSLILPVLITASKSVAWLNPIGIVVSIIVALATALEGLLRSGRKWRLYRQGADAMSSAGAEFFHGLGPYASADPTRRLSMFKEHIEANIRDFHDAYIAGIEVMESQNVINSGSHTTDTRTGSRRAFWRPPP